MSNHRKLSSKLRKEFLDTTSRVLEGLGYGPQGKNLALLIVPVFAVGLGDRSAIDNVRQLSKLELAATSIFTARILIQAESLGGNWDDSEPNYIVAMRIIEVAAEAIKEYFERNNLLTLELRRLAITISAFDTSICV